MKQRILVLGSVAFLLALTGCLLEGGSRLVFRLGLVPADANKIVQVLIDTNARHTSTGDFADGSAISEISPRPYYLYINAPLSGTKAGVQITPDGYRNGVESIVPDFKGVRILAIGGSTTYGWLLEDYHDAWPAQLEALLKQKFQFPVQVINAGLPAGTSAESLVAYVLRDQSFHPDIVVIHNGGNDSHPLYFSDYRPDYSTYRSSVQGALTPRPGEVTLLRHSYFMRLIYATWLKGQNVGTVQTQPVDAPSPAQALQNVKKNEPIGFERNMHSLITLIREKGGRPVLFPFYLAEREVLKFLPESARYAESTYDALTLGIAKNKTVLRKIAAERKIPIFEMEGKTIPAEDFFDHCHLKKGGEAIKAAFLAEKLVPVIRETAKSKGLMAASR